MQIQGNLYEVGNVIEKNWYKSKKIWIRNGNDNIAIDVTPRFFWVIDKITVGNIVIVDFSVDVISWVNGLFNTVKFISIKELENQQQSIFNPSF